eukprot:508222_1
MGNNQSDEQKQNKQVSKQLQKDAKHEHRIPKLLLLGSGGSGKSTLFKQLKCIYGDRFSDQERQTFKKYIHEQVIREMIRAVEALNAYINGDFDDILHQNQRNYIDNYATTEIQEEKDMDDEFDRSLLELSEAAKAAVVSIPGDSFELTNTIVADLKRLWREHGIQKMYEMRNITRIDDNSKYFWDKLDTLHDPNYLPDDTDILKVRHKTKGIKEAIYTVKSRHGTGTFSITDVGGQRTGRKKWIPLFHGMTAVIFVASLSCYDEILDEDDAVNSMTDQLELFDEICNHEELKNTNMILFLNKSDLFKNKIKRVPLTKCLSFVNYQWQKHSYQKCTEYIIE